MVWYPAYLNEKQDLVDWAIQQRPDLKTGHIPDIVMRLADQKIWTILSDEGIRVTYAGTVSGNTVTPADINGLLWAASLSFGLEELSYRGTIHYTPGGLEQTKFGQASHKFMRMQPMFFIPRGSEGLDRMMPFRSFKQVGQQYVEAWMNLYIIERDGRRFSVGGIAFDNTSRGYGWNAQSGFMEYADEQSSGML